MLNLKKWFFYAFIFCLISYFQYYFFAQFTLSTGIISNVIVFLSIVFGFCTTSLSIFATSKYISKLYRVTDSNDPSQTLLHVLVRKFKHGLIVTLVTIVYLVVLEFYMDNKVVPVDMSEIISLPLLGLVIVNFYFCFTLLSILTKVVIQEAKEEN